MSTNPLERWRGQHIVYLLESETTSRTYIGYSVKIERRIRQHNGIIKGGAKYTSVETARPWRVACIISGFDTGIEATKFEWHWKNCHRSTIFRAMLDTRHVSKAVGIKAKIEMARKVASCGKFWFGKALTVSIL